VDIELSTISGKGQKATVNNFMVYPGEVSTKILLGTGTASTTLVINWGTDINPGSFSAFVDRTTDISGNLDVPPSDGGTSTLTIPFSADGRHAVKLSIQGQDPPFGVKTQRDADRFTYLVG